MTRYIAGHKDSYGVEPICRVLEIDPSPPMVYQLRGVSPLIWRRLLVSAGSSGADLHATLQIALGWSDSHLNRFVIQGREYRVAHLGGISFDDDPRRVRLLDLDLRPRERFLYEYDFGDGWQHDVWVETVLPWSPGTPTRRAWEGAVPYRRRIAVAHGLSWSCVSDSRCWQLGDGWRRSSRRVSSGGVTKSCWSCGAG